MLNQELSKKKNERKTGSFHYFSYLRRMEYAILATKLIMTKRGTRHVQHTLTIFTLATMIICA